jgi:hypothetical protein
MCDCYDEKLINYANYNKSLQSCSKKFYELLSSPILEKKATNNATTEHESDNEIFYESNDVYADEDMPRPFDFIDYQDYLISCPHLVKESFYASDYVLNCIDKCPKSCEYERFDTILSTSKYPSEFYLNQILLKNKKLNDLLDQTILTSDKKAKLSDSLISLNIYFSNEQFVHVNQVPYRTFLDLISELGENVGLFLGLSILSTFELIDLAIKLGSIMIKQCLKNVEYKLNKFLIIQFLKSVYINKLRSNKLFY